MSESSNQYNNQEFAQRLHRSLEANRKKRSRHGTVYNITLLAVGIALIAAMVYILVTA
jgi:hypothetical protein